MFWLAAAVLATLAQASVRVAVTPSYFFWDDTQLGAYGQWYELGQRLVSGSFTILDPQAWQGGNLLAEGQWGLWSPLAWAVALFAHALPSAAVAATIIKVAFLVLLCVATFLLARDLGASAPWAAVAAFGAGVGGQTMYLDSPSWVTGLQSVALFTLTWWALRRYVVARRGPIAFLVSAYLLVSVGYVFGVIELVILFVFVLWEEAARGGWRSLARPLLAGVYSGLLTVFVYLPGILTSPVTVRSDQGIANDQFLNMDLSDLATSSTSTAITTVRGYWGDLAPVPLQYMTWLLPLLAILLAGLVARRRDLIAVLGVGALTIALVIGPSVLGPLRYPARMMPYAVLCSLLLVAVLATHAWPAHRSRRSSLAIVTTVAAVGALISWAAAPQNWKWVALGGAIQIAGLMAVVILRGRGKTGRSILAPSAALVVSFLVLMPQIVQSPNSPLGNFRVPSSVQALQAVGDDLPDGVMTVGDVYTLQADPAAYEESLLANLWYATGRDVVGVYTVLPFRAFAADLCIDIRGATCPGAFEALFRTASDDPVPVADDLHLNAVIVIRGEGVESAPEAPSGWTMAAREFTWLYTRDTPTDRAGGVTRTSDGVSVTPVSTSDTEVSFRVDEVPSDGGDVVLSRLAWPGYSVSGATLSDPARGYLVNVSVSPESIGETVTVSFRPPGWTLEIAAAGFAALVAAFMIGEVYVGRRRRKRETPPRPGSTGAVGYDEAPPRKDARSLAPPD